MDLLVHLLVQASVLEYALVLVGHHKLPFIAVQLFHPLLPLPWVRLDDFIFAHLLSTLKRFILILQMPVVQLAPLEHCQVSDPLHMSQQIQPLLLALLVVVVINHILKQSSYSFEGLVGLHFNVIFQHLEFVVVNPIVLPPLDASPFSRWTSCVIF